MSITKKMTFEKGVAEWKIDHMEYGEQYQLTFELGRATKITGLQAEYQTFA